LTDLEIFYFTWSVSFVIMLEIAIKDLHDFRVFLFWHEGDAKVATVSFFID